jgi:hypothetical protein
MDLVKLPLSLRGELRILARKKVLLGGIVVHNEGHYSFGCTIRNLTDNSARITIPQRHLIPRDLYLIKIKAGFAHRARIVWAGEKEAGLRLLDSLDLGTPVEPRLYFLHQIWEACAPR